MICKKCGHKNKDGAKVCESCGASLVDEKNIKNEKIKINKDVSRKRTQRQRQRGKDKDLMSYGLIIGSVMAFAVVFIVLSYFFKLGAEKEMARNNRIESTQQEDIALYKKAIKTSDENIKNKDYKKAIEILKAIPKEAGDYYEEGQAKLDQVEKAIVKDIEKEIADENEKEAEKLATTYADLLPESKALADFKEKLTGKTEKLADKEEEKEVSEEETEENQENEETEANTNEDSDSKDARASRRELANQYDLEALRRNNSYGQNGNPSYTEIYKEKDFLNKNVTVDAHMGEIRTEPNLNSGVAGYVYDGDNLKVSEVVNDGGRYWLKIEGGWISSKLITGEFRD